MEMKVYCWLGDNEREKWICSHLKKLINELESHNNHVKAVGLVNYRSPEAVVFMSQPLKENCVLPSIQNISQLQADYNGAGELSVVTCVNDYVCLKYSESLS
jgi:hypothetical protein